MNLLYNASSIPSALMFAASNEQDFLCRIFGKTLCGDPLDREIGDLIGPSNPLPGGRIPGPVQPKLFTYMRYNAELTSAGLTALGLPRVVPEHVQEMDSGRSHRRSCSRSAGPWQRRRSTEHTSPDFSASA